MTSQRGEFVDQLFVAGVIAAALLAVLFARPLFASDGPVLTDDQIAVANKPGTVMITAHWQSTVIFLKAELNPQGMAAVRAFMQAERKRGVEPQAIITAVLQKLEQNPFDYFIPTKHHMQQPTKSDWGGSGFIITPDGYIVTNEHVVKENEKIDQALVNRGVNTLILKDLQQFEDFLNFDLTPDMENLFVKAERQYYKKYSQLGSTAVEITAEMAIATPGLGTSVRSFICDVRKEGQVTPGKDVAILKIEQHDLPTVPVGDDTRLRIGSRIVVLGYPVAADIEESMKRGLESTLTQGDLSARKTMPGAWDALQTSAEINGGNSGGPAFNDRGEVIGIATFGPGEEGVRGINFLVPSSVVFEFLNEINVKPLEGRLSRMYRDALADFDAHHYKAALEKFQQINNLNPGFPFVQKYITESQAEISAGHDRTLPELPYGTIAAVIVALGIVVTGVWFLMLRRAVPASVPVTAHVGGGTAASTRIEVAPAPLLGSTAAVQPERNFGSIRCTAGPSQGSRYPISKQGLLIGRDSAKCQIVLSDDAVSKEHAWIVPVEDGVVVIDRGSTNGVYVNSTNSPKVNKVRLQHGDRIYIGKGAAVFTYLSN